MKFVTGFGHFPWESEQNEVKRNFAHRVLIFILSFEFKKYCHLSRIRQYYTESN